MKINGIPEVLHNFGISKIKISDTTAKLIRNSDIEQFGYFNICLNSNNLLSFYQNANESTGTNTSNSLVSVYSAPSGEKLTDWREKPEVFRYEHKNKRENLESRLKFVGLIRDTKNNNKIGTGWVIDLEENDDDYRIIVTSVDVAKKMIDSSGEFLIDFGRFINTNHPSKPSPKNEENANLMLESLDEFQKDNINNLPCVFFRAKNVKDSGLHYFNGDERGIKLDIGDQKIIPKFDNNYRVAMLTHLGSPHRRRLNLDGYSLKVPHSKLLSFGGIKMDDGFVYHNCFSDFCSSGSPILNAKGYVVGLQLFGDERNNVELVTGSDNHICEAHASVYDYGSGVENKANLGISSSTILSAWKVFVSKEKMELGEKRFYFDERFFNKREVSCVNEIEKIILEEFRLRRR